MTNNISGITLSAALRIKTQARLGLRLKTARLLSMPETGVAEYAEDLERNPLYEQIRPFVRRVQFPRTRFWSLFDKEERGTAAPGWDVDLSRFEEKIRLVQNIGQESFERYFLYDGGFSLQDIAKASRRPHEGGKAKNGTNPNPAMSGGLDL